MNVFHQKRSYEDEAICLTQLAHSPNKCRLDFDASLVHFFTDGVQVDDLNRFRKMFQLEALISVGSFIHVEIGGDLQLYTRLTKAFDRPRNPRNGIVMRGRIPIKFAIIWCLRVY